MGSWTRRASERRELTAWGRFRLALIVSLVLWVLFFVVH
jgi:hypothetical protein